jgi:hypothetical protein
MADLTTADLTSRWPRAFNAKRRPLAVGIHRAMGLSLDNSAMSRWTNHPTYLRHIIGSSHRIDLEGRKVMRILMYERRYAWAALDRLRCYLADEAEWRRRLATMPSEDRAAELALVMPTAPRGLKVKASSDDEVKGDMSMSRRSSLPAAGHYEILQLRGSG